MASYDDTATVSGSIVRVNDGADSVPLKNWLVTLPASLSGYSEVNAVRSGKNLFDKNNPNEVDGYFTTTGFSTGNANAKTIYIPIKAGATYTVSKTAGQRFQIATAETIPANNATFTNRQAGNTNTSLTITAGANDKYLWAWVFLEGTDTGTLDDMLASIQIEVGSTATSYSAYEAPTTYTASLGRTIYGGTADIVTGEGTETHKKAVFDGSSDENWTLAATGTYRYCFLSNNYIENNSMYTSILCDTITVKNTSENNDDGITCRGTSYASRRFYVFIPIDNDLGITDVTTFKAWLANNPCTIIYPPTTGFEMTFQKVDIQTSKGSNTFWSEQGDSEVTYYKDGYGFTSVTIHKETPDGEPVEQTAKLHKIVYGGLVDVIKGTAKPKNLIPFEPISEYTYLGITYTQYSDGTVKINGTASGGLSFYRVIPNGSDGVHFKSGVTYTLSGCVGGSNTTYQLDLRVENSVVGYYKNAIDYGRGYTFTATEDSVAYPLICVRNGTTVNNVIISPMVEVGSSASEYAPYFEPFSFQPISMETDEGENTLYADEGDSAITYRKEIT